MAAYFQGNPPEISAGADGSLQTLILMNPSTTYLEFSDHHHNHDQQDSINHHNNNSSSSLMFLNSSHAPLPPPPTTASQQFVGIPLSAAAATTDSVSAATIHGFIPRVHYNLYHMDPAMCETPRASAQQGLSLTLSSHQQQQNRSHQPQQIGFESGEDIRVGSVSTGSGLTNGLSGLLSSKYLKAAQELLDEIVNVRSNNINSKTELLSSSNKKGISGDKMTRESSAGAGEGSVCGEVAGKRAAELSTAERQEIQMKKSKLISMLDEVEQRYRQYQQQMQIVITSFEQAAGVGSAKSYTSLALKTISRQFRCLKDAITGQIKVANKCLGEEDSYSGGRFEGSRLRFVDHQLRQQRALQQLGMIQHHHSNNAWRPQRGLPERAVSVLRAWLFEHFLHPYPKDSDKHMLANQTGLTRSQVSNWFINARVRLWKPMVEEMYMEEMKEQEKNNHNNGASSLDNKTDPKNSQDVSNSTIANQEKSPVDIAENYQGSELQGIAASQVSPKRLRTNNEMMIQPINTDFISDEKLSMKVLEERQSLRDGGYSFMGNVGHHYQIDEMSRFDQHLIAQQRFSGNNGVSLTLGLPHCESLSGTHQRFMPNHSIQLGRRVEIGEPDEFAAMNNASTSAPHSSSSAYNGINIQNQKRFVAQLLPDFVA